MSEETLLYLIEQFTEVIELDTCLAAATENVAYTLAELSDRQNGSEHKSAAKKMMDELEKAGF
ncbi:MAG: hypothetical protein WCS17_14085 [Prevotella sp.]